jgi:hypothetical protein
MKYSNKASGRFLDSLELDDIVIVGREKHDTIVYGAKDTKEHLSNYHYKILTAIFDQEELDYARTHYNNKTYNVTKPPKKKLTDIGTWHTKLS